MLPTTLSKRSILLVAALLFIGACKSQGAKPTDSKRSSEEASTSAAAANPAPSVASDGCALATRSFRFEAPGPTVAIGDIHGDLQAARRALRLAGAIDAADRWVGGDLSVVQTGDILDRGDDEQEILELFDRLAAEANAAGGAIHRVNGNHELMNAMGDFRYVTRGGYEDFVEGDVPTPLTAEARAEAFLPGGRYARQLADNDLVIIVDDSVFVHGGVLPRFVATLEAANRDSRCFLLGDRAEPPEAVTDPEGPLWTRVFSSEAASCELLQASLELLGVSRMVVGHTPQLEGITSACDDKVWRVDTGMASFYKEPTQVLEIDGDAVRILSGRREIN